MKPYLFYAATDNPAIACAAEILSENGYRFSPDPTENVTHLLLPVPSVQSDGQLRGGGSLSALLEKLPARASVIGGNLPPLPQRRVWDLLKDPDYVAENAYITAHCAVRLLLERLPGTLRGCPILILGWGRIGKCLCALLRGLDANITVAARKETDRAILRALGFQAMDAANLQPQGYDVIFNTVPNMLLPEPPKSCLKIDLASTPGLGGENVIHARGLPGKDAPRASGKLIARKVTEILNREATI